VSSATKDDRDELEGGLIDQRFEQIDERFE
jgi:hypothetical protein